MPQSPEISIVVPLFNEEENVAPLCAALDRELAGWPRRWEALLVDDGSRDRTLERLVDEARRDPRLRVLSLRRNAGQTLALAAGFCRARGQIVVSMDGDLQNDPQDIPRLVERIEAGADVVCGWRRDRQDAWLSRKLPSRIANRCIAWLTGVPVHDNGCTLKAFRAEVIRTLNLYAEMHRFLPALSSMTGARIEELVVRHHARRFGTSKYGIGRTLRVVGDMLATKMITRFAHRPGMGFGLLALPWCALALVAGAAWAVGRWLFDQEATIVFQASTLMFVYLAGHLLMLAALGELFLAHADRRQLRQIHEALVVEISPTPLGLARS